MQAPPGSKAVDEYKGVRIYREKYGFLNSPAKKGSLSGDLIKYVSFFIRAALRLTRLHLQRHYHTIQVHNMPDFLVFCAVIPKLLGVPVILDMHELMPELFRGQFGARKAWLAWLIRLQEKLACKFADHVITVTKPCWQALIQRGVPESKCSMVMNVADEKIFYPRPHANGTSSGSRKFGLIYHGTLVKRNGLDLAIQAVDRVRAEIPGVHLTLIGRGKFLPEMKRMVEELGISDYVTFEDLRLAEELPDMISACQLGVVPIRSDPFTEFALPTKLMEYAAMGLPAVAARTPVNEFYFKNTNTEFFEPGDADDLARCLLKLYQDPNRMTELARGSENFNRQYNWLQISAEYVAMVNGLDKTTRRGERP